VHKIQTENWRVRGKKINLIYVDVQLLIEIGPLTCGERIVIAKHKGSGNLMGV
jgi:hypothetical protein